MNEFAWEDEIDKSFWIQGSSFECNRFVSSIEVVGNFGSADDDVIESLSFSKVEKLVFLSFVLSNNAELAKLVDVSKFSFAYIVFVLELVDKESRGFFAFRSIS
jgi:hypothetical protein